jgi:hypothetical protein
VEILFGRDKDTGDWEIASYRLPLDDWSETEARSFCTDHDGILFEPATGEEDTEDAPDVAASDTAPEAVLDTAERSLRLQRAKLALHGIHNQKEE